MKIDIKATNMDLTPSITDYVNEKVGALARFINIDTVEERNSSVVAYVEVAKTTKHHKNGDVFKAEINLKLNGDLLRADAHEWDLMVAIDSAREIMERQLTQGKDEKRTKKIRGARSLKKFLSISPLARFRKK